MINPSDLSDQAAVACPAIDESNSLKEYLLFLKKHLIEISYGLFLTIYAFFFWKNLSRYWFSPNWTTDDALQQSFPFHSVFHPNIFKDDLIARAMEGYLAPAHYWLGYFITLLTRDPIMTGHWMMLIQLTVASIFLFLAVKHIAGVPPALFSVAWLLHTRNIVQRMTGGLPRGWAAAVLTAYLFFLFCNHHRAVLLVILVGCFLHPPATLIIATSYGLYLLWQTVRVSTRVQFKRPLLVYVVLAPLYCLITLYVLHRPPEIGVMTSYHEAASMPEFTRPGGRFPFIPFRSVLEELKVFGFQAFISKWYNPGLFMRQNIAWLVLLALILVVGVGRYRHRAALPPSLYSFLIAILVVYFASRILAFKLYVPDRHLQFPLGVFFIVAFSAGLWRVFAYMPNHHVRTELPAALALVFLGLIVALASGTGLYGAANFNYPFYRHRGVWAWMRDAIPEDALVAGHPTHMDPIQLFGMRRGYVTTETTHPFYPQYYTEIKRRLKISLSAHYAKDLRQLVEILKAEKIDYFIFDRGEFLPASLRRATFFLPLDTLVKDLTSGPFDAYAYRQLPRKVNLQKSPFMPYKDNYSVVIDVKKLAQYLENGGA